MSYIYFYHEGSIHNNALAISKWIVDFSEFSVSGSKYHKQKIPKRDAIFNIKYETRLDPGIVNPKESDKYIWKTAFIENKKSS